MLLSFVLVLIPQIYLAALSKDQTVSDLRNCSCRNLRQTPSGTPTMAASLLYANGKNRKRKKETKRERNNQGKEKRRNKDKEGQRRGLGEVRSLRRRCGSEDMEN
ncbi:unnamed protein product [Cuscuta epithymum]|uniref:Secreted protein n=1 Tax=Cuscuta epithymum TaxID=186058 RepID=A0AAV0CAK4_9ASTE|nr:unnamed protein product [Cuscuta epithymum]